MFQFKKLRMRDQEMRVAQESSKETQKSNGMEIQEEVKWKRKYF